MFKLRFRNLFSLLLGALLIFFALSACDSNGSDGDDDGVDASGDASVNISGNGVDRSFDWDAFFATGTDPDTGESGFIVYLVPNAEEDPSQASSAIYIARGSARPGTGDYSVGSQDGGDTFESEFGLFGILSAGSQSVEFIESTGGTLTISSSDDDRVKGSFDIEGTYTDATGGGEEVPVDITGNFDAPGGDFFTPGGF